MAHIIFVIELASDGFRMMTKETIERGVYHELPRGFS